MLKKWIATFVINPPAKNTALSLLAGAAIFGLLSLTPLRADSAHGSFSTIANDKKAVKISTKRDGAITHFLVENQEFCDITMTFEMAMENLSSTQGFPCTRTFPARSVTEAFILAPASADSKWAYQYTNYYKLGSSVAVHDDSFVYQLPYAAGAKYKVTQAYGGTFSHKGSNLNAIDWKMAEGTPVLAARGGVVVRVKDDSDTGGSSMKYDQYNNFVLIQHDDGTLGHYCHLQKASVKVGVGDRVEMGRMLARSGNTGFSSGPHLHFCVFKTKDGKERVSIPVKFSTADEKATTLVSGKTYKAPELEAFSSRTIVAGSAGSAGR